MDETGAPVCSLEEQQRMQMSVIIPSLGGEKQTRGAPAPRPLFFLYLCEQWISTPHPRTSSGRNHRSTPGSRKQAEQRRRNGDVLSGSVSSFEEALPSCQLGGFFVVFFFPSRAFIPPPATPQTELIAAAEWPGRDVASQPHVHIVQFLFNETRRWALLQSRSHLLIPPHHLPQPPLPHTPPPAISLFSSDLISCYLLFHLLQSRMAWLFLLDMVLLVWGSWATVFSRRD